MYPLTQFCHSKSTLMYVLKNHPLCLQTGYNTQRTKRRGKKSERIEMYREKKAVFHHKEKGKSSATRVVWQTRMCYGKSHGDLGGEARCLLDIRGALMSTTPCACFGSHACLAGVFTKHRAMGRRQACGMLRLRRVRRQARSRTRAGEVRNADCSAPLGTATASCSSRPGVLSS